MTYTEICLTFDKNTCTACIETTVTMNRVTLAHNVIEYGEDTAQDALADFINNGGRLLYEDANTAEYTI